MITANQAFAQTHAVNPFNLRVLDTSLAAALGVNEAIFLDRLKFWLSKGYGILHKGKRWIYNTYQQWITKELPWLSYDQFKRMIKRLLELGVLMIEKLKAHEWKQTNFYTINEEVLKAKITMPNASGGCADSNSGSSPNDLYTDQTTDQTESDKESFSNLDSVDLWFANEEEAKEELQEVNCPSSLIENSQDSGDDQGSEPVKTNLQLEPFHKELLRILQFCDEINNPWAYAQKCVDNLRAGSPSSVELYEKWLESGEIVVEDIIPEASEKGKNPSSVKPNQEGVTQQGDQPKPKNEGKVNQELREWQIQPTDTDLIEAGYSVGDIYPEFVQWATPRLKYHPDLTEYAAKAHVLKKLKFEPQLALELWQDFKRLLVREYEDKQEMEQKGQRYFTPAWMQLPADVPVNEARKASVELNETKAKEQQAIEANRSQKPAFTGGEDEKAIESSEEEELSPIESVKNAIESSIR